MMTRFNTFILAAFATVALSSCSINPSTWGNAVRGHDALPALSMAVMECTSSRPDIQEQIREPFNVLIDMWTEAKDLEPKDALTIGSKLGTAKAAWTAAKTPVVESRLDCGVWVRTEVKNIETTFAEFEAAIGRNAYAVTALQYADLLASIVGAKKITVQRM